jgi:heme oxygenase
MTVLRDITNDKHREVEQTPLIQYMFNEKISEEFYKMYLSELYYIYKQLEECADSFNLFDGLEELPRTKLILDDLFELKALPFDLCKSTEKYLEYLQELDSTQIMAHIYVRHMGDLYGGKMLSRIVPGSGRCYQFDNRKQLVYNFNERITLDLADEALKAFDIFIEIFNEMWERWNNMNSTVETVDKLEPARYTVYIHRCVDAHKWYYKLIGQHVVLLDEEKNHTEYKCLQPDGYINFVDKKDGILVPVGDD